MTESLSRSQWLVLAVAIAVAAMGLYVVNTAALTRNITLGVAFVGAGTLGLLGVSVDHFANRDVGGKA